MKKTTTITGGYLGYVDSRFLLAEMKTAMVEGRGFAEVIQGHSSVWLVRSVADDGKVDAFYQVIVTPTSTRAMLLTKEEFMTLLSGMTPECVVMVPWGDKT